MKLQDTGNPKFKSQCAEERALNSCLRHAHALREGLRISKVVQVLHVDPQRSDVEVRLMHDPKGVTIRARPADVGCKPWAAHRHCTIRASNHIVRETAYDVTRALT